jgi:microcompartment protein CcmL/EutN
MQANIALGLLEISSIAKGVEAADAMCKAAGITLSKAYPTSRGKFVIVISGPVGEVESSLRAGREMAGAALMESYIIRNVHKEVLSALSGKLKYDKLEALGFVETKDVVPAIYAADIAAKAAHVHMIEVRAGSGIGGKGYFSVTGEVGAVRSAVAAAAGAIGPDKLVSRIVIPNAHEQLKGTV